MLVRWYQQGRIGHQLEQLNKNKRSNNNNILNGIKTQERIRHMSLRSRRISQVFHLPSSSVSRLMLKHRLSWFYSTKYPSVSCSWCTKTIPELGYCRQFTTRICENEIQRVRCHNCPWFLLSPSPQLLMLLCRQPYSFLPQMQSIVNGHQIRFWKQCYNVPLSIPVPGNGCCDARLKLGWHMHPLVAFFVIVYVAPQRSILIQG